jgi:hypothetical protein
MVVCQSSGLVAKGVKEKTTQLGRPSFDIHKTDTRKVSLRLWGVVNLEEVDGLAGKLLAKLCISDE